MVNKIESDTYLLVFGSGADLHSWWKSAQGNAITRKEPLFADFTGWSVDVTMETGEGDTITKTIDHQALMEAARTIVNPGTRPDYIPWNVVEDIQVLHKGSLDVDLDANGADILVQVAMLGEVVFG